MEQQLTITVVGTDAQGKERICSRVASNSYDVNELESLVERALAEATLSVEGANESALHSLAPEVSISLVANGVRPSLHLSAALLARIARVGASVDFDPYV